MLHGMAPEKMAIGWPDFPQIVVAASRNVLDDLNYANAVVRDSNPISIARRSHIPIPAR